MSRTKLTDGLTTDRAAGVMRVRLEAPERGNALTYAMMEAIAAVCEEAQDEPDVRVVAFEGAGASFCTGEAADLGAWPDRYAHRRPAGSHGPPPIPQQNMLRRLRSLSRPTVAVLKGRTIGLGLDLAAVCDIRMAAGDAQIGDDRVPRAQHAATGITHVLPRLVGLSQAVRLLLLGENVDATEAARIGFVHFVVEPDQLEVEVEGLLARLADMATRSYGVVKQQVIDELDMPYETALMHSMAIRQTNVIEDRAEGALAFREKRPPRFTGR